MLKAINFDFDGVIVDTERNKFNDLKKILHNKGFALNKSDFKDMLGKKTEAFLSVKFPNMKSEKREEILKLRRKMQLSKKNIKLIPGIKQFLKFIKSEKIKMAITTGSSKKCVKKILKNNQIDSFFDMQVTGEDFKKSKPSPECYKAALKKLDLNPKEVIVIEDSTAGIKAAKDANCKVFGIKTYLGKKDLREADLVFNNHRHILDYFKHNNKSLL